jgi:hemolysin D
MKSAKLIPLPTRTAALVPRDRSRTELEFLPAALEIVETPASPAGRAIAAVIILFFISALAWATFGHIEIVATAPGKIVPTGRTKIIQPLEIGTVRAIHVQEGQSVRAGEVLVELDPTTSEADRNRQAAEFLAARLDAARLSAMVAESGDAEAAFAAPPGATPTQVALARQLIISQSAEHRAKLAELDRQKAQSEANRAAVAANVEKLNAIVPLLRQRFEMRAYLYDKQYGSKLNYLDAQQDLVDKENELEVQKSRLAEAEAALQVVNAHRLQSEAEFRRLLLADLKAAQDKADSLAQELVKAERRMQGQTLTAPVDGVVQQLSVHTVGGVVTPAQTLMVVVPADSRLEIEAMVSNRDIGFVRAGERAEIKVDTFNFTRYGLLRGDVLSVSSDAVDRETQAGPGEEGAAKTPAPAARRELSYVARISLDRTAMDIDGRSVNLRPGMAVTAEINTGTRRVIEYLLSPLLRYREESLRER